MDSQKILRTLVIVVLILLLLVANLAILLAKPVLHFRSQQIQINALCVIPPVISQMGDATVEILKT